MEIFGEGYSTTFELLECTADAVMTCYLLWLPRVEKRHTTLFIRLSVIQHSGLTSDVHFCL